MKLKICFLLLLCPIFRAGAQGKNTPSRQWVPDILISNVLNYQTGGRPVNQLRLSDFKDKLLILDFWGTFCTPCLRLLPKYDSLQRELGDKVQFLLVSQEHTDKVAAFLKRFNYSLPSVTSDIILSDMFPHTSIPHEVWIRKGKVIATTYAEEVSKETILKVIAGDITGIEQKKDDLAFDPLEPLLANGNGKGEVLYQSIITPYNPALNSVEGFRKTPQKTSSVALNHSALALYRQAFAHTDPLLDLDNRTVLELPDSLQNKVAEANGTVYRAWIKKYGFCYGLVLPPDFKGDIATVMATDLNRFFGARFGITARLEQRELDCLVLARIPGAPSIESKGGNPVFSVPRQGMELKNLPMSSLDIELARLYRKLPAPFLDETGYGPIDIKLNCDLSNLEALKAELLKSGLSLTIKKRAISMLVIRQLSPGQF